jgi:drug/metabolite transporter (DMT)-like permease
MGNENRKHELLGASSLVGAAFIIGTFGLWIRLISPMFSNAAQTTGRFFIAALLIVVIFALRRKPMKLKKKDFLFAAIIGVAGFGTGFLFTVAANTTKVATSLSLLYGGGIISAALIGPIFLKEKFTFNKALGLALAIIGLGMYAHDFASIGLGAFAAVGAGVCDSVAHGFRKRLRGVDRNTVVMYQYLLGGIFALTFTLVSGGPSLKEVSFWPVIGLVIYGAASVGLGNLLLYGFSRLDVNAGAVILATQLFFVSVLGMIFLHEFPSWLETTGLIFIFLAAVATVINSKRILQRFSRQRFIKAAEPRIEDI